MVLIGSFLALFFILFIGSTDDSIAADTIDSGTCGPDVNWTLDDEGILHISGTGPMNNYQGYETPEPWKSHSNEITAVQLSGNITYLGSNSFTGCSAMTNAELNDGLEIIGIGAFSNCSSLTTITLPSTVETICDSAFTGCTSLSEFEITGNVKHIGYAVFGGCTSLTEIKVSQSNQYFVASNGVLFTKDMTTLVQYPAGKTDTGYEVPSSVSSIGYMAFINCQNLHSVIIPDSVTVIGEAVFLGCRTLESVQIPTGLTIIPASMFANCSSLRTVTLPAGITAIPDSTFLNCFSLENIDIPDTVESIGTYAFGNCVSISELNLPDGIITIGNESFIGCTSITEVEMPNSVTSLGYGAFRGCTGLASIVLSNQLTGINSNAFDGCSQLEEIVLPSGVQTIGFSSFRNCISLKSITFSDELTLIDQHAFSGCVSLAFIDFPDSLQYIGYGAFYGCSSITTVTISDNVSSIDEYAFAGCPLSSIYVGDGLSNLDWLSENGSMPELLKSTLLTVELGANIEIKYNQFYGCKNLQSVTLPENLETIGGSAFNGCESLQSITIPDNVTSIGGSAFQRCGSLQSITIPYNVVDIGSYAFFGCVSLTNIDLPDSIEYIGDGAFENCESLQSIVIPASVSEIKPSTFNACTLLSTVTIPDTVSEMGYRAFGNCNSLNTIIFPSSLVAIGDEAFISSGLTVLVIPDSVISIGYHSFHGCPIRDLSIGNGLESIWALNDYKDTLETVVLGSGLTELPSGCFSGFSSLRQVTLGPNIQSIGDYSFAYCGSLESIDLPDSVTVIGDYSFTCCSSLHAFSIGDNVVSIGEYAFSECPLESIYLGNGMTSLPSSVNLDVQYISFGNGVENFDIFSLYGCMSLISITVPDSNTHYSSSNGVLFDKEKKTLLKYPSGKTDISYTIPGSVETIVDMAFNGCQLEEITIPDNVTAMDYGAFYNCCLKRVDTGDGLETLNGFTFNSNLVEIRVGEGITTIESDKFAYCNNLVSVELPSSLISIGSGAFRNCSSLISIHIPEGVTEIGGDAFSGCSLLVEICNDSALPIGDDSNDYGKIAYYAEHIYSTDNGSSYLKTVSCNDGKDEFIFLKSSDSTPALLIRAYTNSETIVLPMSFSIGDDVVTTYKIRANSFDGNSNIKSLTIPEGVTIIEQGVLRSCTSLRSISLPQSLTSMNGEDLNCSSDLEEIVLNEANTSYVLENGVLFSNDKWRLLCYPSKKIGTEYTVPEAVHEIMTGAFSNSIYLSRLYISDNVTYLGAQTNCDLELLSIGDGLTSLESISVSADVIEIGKSVSNVSRTSASRYGSYVVDEENPYFTSVDGVIFSKDMTHIIAYPREKEGSYAIPDTVTSINDCAFYRSVISEISFNEHLECIGDSAFFECQNLTDIELPDSLETIGTQAFAYCGNIRSVVFGNGLASTGDLSFMECSNLESIEFGDSISTIGQAAFTGCSELESVVLGNNISRIGERAFSHCTSLNNFDYGDGTSSMYIGQGAFAYCTNLMIEIPDRVSTIFSDTYNTWTTLGVPIYFGTGLNSNPLESSTFYDGDCQLSFDEVKGYTFVFRNDWSFHKCFEARFIPNGGTGSEYTALMHTSEETQIEECTYTRDGYAFIGWNTESDGTGDWYEDESSIVIEHATVLYAQWVPIICTSFVNNDGSDEQTDIDQVYGKQYVLPENEPKRDGHSFAGWFTDPIGGTEITEETVVGVEGDCVIYAHWTVNQYTIIFYGYDHDLYSQTLDYGDMPSYEWQQLGVFYYYGQYYTLAGWYQTLMPATENVSYSAVVAFHTNGTTVWVEVNDDSYGSVSESALVAVTMVYTEYNDLHLERKVVTATPAESTAQYEYEFDYWVTPDEEIFYPIFTAVFSRTVKSYQVTVTDDGSTYGSAYLSMTMEYGTAYHSEDDAIYFDNDCSTNAYPANSTVQYVYEFDHWINGDGIITGDTVITAVFKRTLATYTVNFNSDYEVVLQSTVMEYGSMPSYEGETPTKVSDDQYSYAFSGWSPEIVAVAGDVTYYAQFDSTVRTYTVQFVDYDDTVLQSSILEYGATPEYTGETPEREPDEEYTYWFAGWTPEIGTVRGDTTYRTIYGVHINEYAVTFAVNNAEYGTVSETVISVAYGEYAYADGNVLQIGEYEIMATPSEDTPKYRYAFVSWSVDYEPIQGDTTITATFSRTTNTCRVTIGTNNPDYGNVIGTITVDYGTGISVDNGTLVIGTYRYYGSPAESDVQYSYRLDSWSYDSDTVTQDMTVTGNYVRFLNVYSVVFKGYYEENLQWTEYEYGTTPVYEGDTPARSGDSQYSYEFSGWTPDIGPVTGNITYYPTFTQILNRYTITFVVYGSEYGSVSSDSITVDYGTEYRVDGDALHVGTETITATAIQSNAEFTYAFRGWSIDDGTVQCNLNFPVWFDRTTNTYSITIVSDNNEYGSVTGDCELIQPYGTTFTVYGSTLSINGMHLAYAEPTAADAQYTYNFIGWSVDENYTLTSDVTVAASFGRDLNSYTVRYVNHDGTVLQQHTVEYGSMPPAYGGQDPVMEADEEFSYSFEGWSPAFAQITGDVDYHATFSRTVNTYTVTISSNNEGYGTVSVATLTVQYGTQLIMEGDTLTIGDTVVTATPADSDAQYTYSLSYWYTDEYVYGDVSATAYFSRTVNTYTVTIVPNDVSFGDVSMGNVTVEYGTVISPYENKLYLPYAEVTATAAESHDHYVFAFDRWDYDSATVVSDMTVTAVFSRSLEQLYFSLRSNNEGYGIVTYSGLYVDYGAAVTIDGPKITVGNQEIQACPNLPSNEYVYEFVEFSDVPQFITEDTVSYAVFRAVQIEYTVTFLNYDGTVLQTSVHRYSDRVLYNGDAPAREGNAQYTYVFTGWDTEVTDVWGDATYTAVFRANINQYCVTIVPNEPGYGSASIPSFNVDYGETLQFDGIYILTQGVIISTAEPNESDVQYIYSFLSWTYDTDTVTEDITVTANFSRELRAYTVRFSSDDPEYGSVSIDELTVAYGTTVSAENNILTIGETTVSAIPAEAAGNHSFCFNYWISFTERIEGDFEYVASFSMLDRFLIQFCDHNGTVLQQNYVNSGDMPEFRGDLPVREADAQYGYYFDGWLPSLEQAWRDTVYTASYNSFIREYLVQFVDYDGTILQSGYMQYGEMPQYTSFTPAKQEDEQYNYSFAGWSPEIDSVVNDVTYTAQYSNNINSYNVSIDLNNWEYGSVTLPGCVAEYGTRIIIDGNTLRIGETEIVAVPHEDSGACRYSFIGWTANTDTILSDTRVTAIFEMTVLSYHLTFLYDEGGEIYTERDVTMGAVIEYPADPETDGRRFIGWNEKPVTMPASDISLIAQWADEPEWFLGERSSRIDIADGNLSTIEDDTYTGILSDKYNDFIFGEKRNYSMNSASFSEYIESYINSELAGQNIRLRMTSLDVVTGTMSATYIPNTSGAIFATDPLSPDSRHTMDILYDAIGHSDLSDVQSISMRTNMFLKTYQCYDILVESGGSITDGMVMYSAISYEETDETMYVTETEYTLLYKDGSSCTVTVRSMIHRIWNESSSNGTIGFSVDLRQMVYEFDNIMVATSVDRLNVANGHTPSSMMTAIDSEWVDDRIPTNCPFGTVTSGVSTGQIASDNENEVYYKVAFKDAYQNGMRVYFTKSGEVPRYNGETPAKDDTNLYRYVFRGWNIQQDSVDVLEYLLPASSDVTYYPVFETIDMTCSVTFVGYDGTVLESLTVPMGTVPSYSLAIPSRADDQTYSYTFIGWNTVPGALSAMGALPMVYSDTVFYPVFEPHRLTCTITFKDTSGRDLETITVSRGTVPVFSQANPTRAADEMYSYSFIGWNTVQGSETAIGSLPAAIHDTVYYPVFSRTAAIYEITFLYDEGGELYCKVQCGYGSVIQYPDAPSREGLVFSSWSQCPWTMPSENIVIYATWMEIPELFSGERGKTFVWSSDDMQYLLSDDYFGQYKWTANGLRYEDLLVGGNKIDCPTDSTRYEESMRIAVSAETGSTYHFRTAYLDTVRIALTATYPVSDTDEMFSGYTVSGAGDDLSDLLTALGLSGDRQLQTVSMDLNIAEISCLTEDSECGTDGHTDSGRYYYAYISMDTRQHTKSAIVGEYTFVFSDGSSVTFHIRGKIVEDWTEIYSLTSGSNTSTMTVDAELTVGGRTFILHREDSDNSTFDDASTTGLDKSTVDRMIPLAESVLTIRQIESLCASADVFFVRFCDADGEEIKSYALPWDDIPAFNGTTPMKESSTDITVFEFIGWSTIRDSDTAISGFSALSDDATFYPVFKEKYITYRITFVGPDGSILDIENIVKNTIPQYKGTDPVKPSTAGYDYSFIGWGENADSENALGSLLPATADRSYYAIFSETVRYYTVSFKDTEIIKTVQVAYGERISPEDVPNVPFRADTEQYAYSNPRWSGFDITSPVIADVTLEAEYDATVKRYTVSFYAEQNDTDVFFQQTAEYGTPIRLPASLPTKDGFVFKEWSGFTPGVIHDDVSYYGIFVPGETTSNADGTVTTIIEEDDTVTVTTYNTDGTATVRTETSEQTQNGTTTVNQDVIRETSKDGYGVETVSSVNIVSKDTDVSTTAVVGSESSVSETVIGAQADVSGTVNISDLDIGTALFQLERVETEVTTVTERTVTVNASGDTKDTASAVISADALKSIGASNSSFSLKANVGTVIIDKAVAESLSANVDADSKVTLSIANADRDQLNEAQQKAVGDHTVIRLSAIVGSSSVHELGGNAKIIIPYQLKSGENAENVTVFYVNDKGDLRRMSTTYDPETGTVTFETDHFSYYFVAQESYQPPSDSDDKNNTMIFIIAGIIGAAILVGAVVLFKRRC